MKNNFFKTEIILLILTILLFIWSGINPKEYFTWFLEVLPAVIGMLLLIFTYKKFRFTRLLYILIFFHLAILIIGGHYTYAEVPLFDHIKEMFGQSRNNYDKLGHFAQGFVPAMIVREILIRKNVVNGRKWLNFIIVSICIAISAVYELIEWLVSVLSGEGGDSFLGTQGYIWDTQSDILYATIGAIAALLLLSGIHDKVLGQHLKK